MKNLQEIKDTYAQEQGYEDWKELREELYGNVPELRIEKYMDEICIRAQKAALEKAAGKSEVQHHNTRTGTKTHASGMGGNGQVYTVNTTSITDPENLIR